ncbi:hypothetical protein ACFSWE_04030 [Leucobacter albus]|uniref:Uncharacterized protein n=1 Tax=Leucobacter albus TaxID=272210 RepID=A0ABW3TR74_9MICO
MSNLSALDLSGYKWIDEKSLASFERYVLESKLGIPDSETNPALNDSDD